MSRAVAVACRGRSTSGAGRSSLPQSVANRRISQRQRGLRSSAHVTALRELNAAPIDRGRRFKRNPIARTELRRLEGTTARNVFYRSRP